MSAPQTTDSRLWTARVRRLPEGDVAVSLGGAEHVMSASQAERLEALLIAVRVNGRIDTGEVKL